MAEQTTDLSDIAVKDPAQPSTGDRSLANSYDLRDIGASPETPNWRNRPVDLKALDLSDLGSREPEPKAYSVANGMVQFAPDKPATGLQQAVNDGVIDKQYADKHLDDFRLAQVKYQDFQDAAGNAQVAKALLSGAGRGAAFLAGAIPGGKAGAGLGALIPGAEEVTVPVGAAIGSLTTGTIAAAAYGKAVDKLGDYNDFMRELQASAELHPVANAAGELAAFATSAPKSLANLYKLSRLPGGASAAAAQVLKGAAAGAAFEGVIRPGFDVARHVMADQLGISHEETQAPTLTSLAQNVALGILTAGHSVAFRDYTADEMINLMLRAKAREAAGIPMNADDPAAVIRGFQSMGARPTAELQRNGLLRPLDAGETAVYADLVDQMDALRKSGQLTDNDVESLGARQATIRSFTKSIPISRASVTLKPRAKAEQPTQPEESNADQIPSPMAQAGAEQAAGVQPTGGGPAGSVSQPAGARETQGAQPTVAAPSPASQTPAAPLAPAQRTLTPDPKWQVTVQPSQFDQQTGRTVPGFVQIDSVSNGVNEWSSNPDKLKEQGYVLPDFSGLPTGRYTLDEAMGMLANPQAAAKPTKRVGVKLSPTGEIPSTPAPTVPETPETINEQVKMLKEGKRNAILITPGEKMPGIPKGHVSVKAPQGIVIYNPQKLLPEVVDKAIREDKLGDILGYGIPAKPAPGTEVGAVVVRNPQGVEKQGVLTDAQHLPAVKAAAEAVASPGDTISMESEAQVIAKRQGRVPAARRPGETKKEWKEIGANSRGQKVYEDANGVRSYVDKGVRVTEPVALVPTRAGVLTRPSTPRADDYKTVDELAGGPKVTTDVDTRTEGQSRGSGAGGQQSATAGQPGGEQPATGDLGQPGESVQPGIQPANAEGRPAGGTGDSRVADADANGVPALAQPEAPLVPSADTGVESSPSVRGEPTEANPAPEPEIGADPKPRNIRLTENPAPTGAVARIKANIDAISVLRKLDAENRPPTEDERKTLAQWSGWGSFKELFNTGRAEKREWDQGWLKRYGQYYDKLQKLLSPDEFNAAAESSVNAHYTSKEVVDAMWSLAKRLGFKGGKALEPSTGSGVFVGYIPDDLARKTRWTGVEMEPITGRIFSLLYPEAEARIQPFENTKLPNAFYDLVITNVPFHEVGPGKEYPSLNLHNYFIARSLDKVKPGGLVVIITTNGTLDNDGNGRREQRGLLADKGQLVGAIRLPNNAFKESAGTEVVTDILVLRKADGKPFDQAQPFRNTTEIEIEDGKARVNQYFAEHPEMVLGRNALTGTMYQKNSYTVEGTAGSLSEKLAQAVERFPADITQREEVSPESEPVATQLEEGSLSLDSAGRLLEARNFLLQRPEWSTPALEKRARLYLHVRDVLKQQYAMEDDPQASEAEIEANRARLNRTYHALVKDLGAPLNQSERKLGFLATDPDYYTVLGLEVFRERPDPKSEGSTLTVVEPADVLSKRVKTPDVPPLSAANALEALGVSLAYKGGFDLEYVKQLTGMSADAIERELLSENQAFKDPDSGKLEITGVYLSGDVRDKLAKATFAAKESDEFARNVEALKKVIPDTVPFARIKLNLDARWAPVSVFNTFAKEIIGLRGDEIKFVPGLEEFAVENKREYQLSDVARTQFSTKDMTATELLSHAMNFQRAKIMRSDSDGKSYEDKDASALANQLIDRMQEEFQRWMRTTETRVPYHYFDQDRGDYVNAELPVWDALEREFNRTKNSFIEPSVDASVLKLPGLSNLVLRKPHLMTGVMRAILQGSAVYAHGVGSGKAQPLDAKILTPSGWKRMGDIRVGEFVIGQDGLPTRVIGVYPQGEKDVFEIVFSDGAKTRCCDEHLWLTQTYYERSKQSHQRSMRKVWLCSTPKVRQLSEIRKSLYTRAGSNGLTANHSIPMVEPVEFPPANLPIHPYVLGVLLGDGCLRLQTPIFTTDDPEMAERVKSLLPPGHRLTERNYEGRCPSYAIVGNDKINDVAIALKQLGLMGTMSVNKFVPEQYLFASIQQRLELLRGLMDTDGWNEKSKNACCFGSISEKLVNAVRVLVNSLGGTISVCSKIPKFTYKGKCKEGQKSYTVSLRLPPELLPFALTRKIKGFVPKSKYRPVRTIVDVRTSRREQCQCIAVENPNHLYVTDDFIVTHNTFLSIVAMHELQRIGLMKKGLIVIKKPTVDQFRNSIERAYPGSRVLIPSEKDFERVNRKKLASRIASGKWDFVVVTHEQFKAIRTSEESVNAFFNDQIEQLRQILRSVGGSEKDENAKSTRGLDPAVRNIVKKIKSLKKRLSKHTESVAKTQDVGLEWEKLGMDGIWIDECFPFDTKIMTDRGLISIGDIVANRLKVRVLSKNLSTGKIEWKPIVKWYTMPLVKRLVTVTHEHGQFTCTTDHKIWTTNRGYVHASHLAASDSLIHTPVRMVQDQSHGQDDQSLLQPVMLGFMAECTAALTSQRVGARETWRQLDGSNERTQKRIPFSTHDFEQSHVRSRECPKDEEKESWKNVSFERRQRPTDGTTEETVCCVATSSLEYGIRNQDGSSRRTICFAAKQLQGGYSDSCHRFSNRSGRTKSQNQEVEILGPPENGNPSISRVVGIKIHERASESGHCFSDSPSDCVYDIEVEGNHNFFAEGVLVSNCHNYKKMPIPTQMDNVKGIPVDFSQRAVDLLIKIRDVQRRTNGRNVFFASGTPVSNTLAELWVMLHATNPKLLKQFGVETFDSFATTFADVVSNFELGWDEKFKDVTRMARFKNPGGLTMLTRLGVDVRIGNKELGLDVPELEGGKPVVRIIKATPAFDRWIAFLKQVVSKWESLDPKGRFENSWVPITAMRAGAAAALDPRSAFEDGLDHPQSKVNTAVQDIFGEWEKGKDRRTTMMVFADMYRTLNTSKLRGFAGISSQPTTVEVGAQEAEDVSDDTGDTGARDADAYERNSVGNFNLYQDIKAKLIARGVPESDIAVISDYDTDVKRAALFNKVRSGAVRILMGSTEKIGEGVDVPQRMSAQFHLDPPMQMTPAKMEQRFGRIIRQGNLHSPKNWNLPVRIFLYAQERSMDAAIYQMLENKGIMVLQFLKGQYLGDEFDDPAGEFTLQMAEMKAAATGDTRVLELAKLQKEVRELRTKDGAFHRRISELRRDVDQSEYQAKSQAEEARKYTTLAQAMAKETENDDTVVLTHKDKRYTGMKAVDAFLERARPALEDSLKEQGAKAVMHMKLGTTVNIKVEGETKRSAATGNLMTNYEATFYIGPELNWGVPNWESSLNSIESLMTAAKRVPQNAEKRATDAITRSKEAARLAEVYAKTFRDTNFPEADLLKEKSARLYELESELRTEGAKKPTEPDPKEVEVGDIPPVEDRLKAQLAANVPALEKLAQDITRAQGRMAITERGSDDYNQAKADNDELSVQYNALDNRIQDLERRLAVVVKNKNPNAPVDLPAKPAGPELNIEPTPSSAGEERVVRGLQELSALLANPRCGLSADARRVALDLLNTPVMQNLDWSNLTVALKNRIAGGYSGAADAVQNFIEISKAVRPSTLPHEVFHLLFAMLTPEDKAHVESARREALQAELDKQKADNGALGLLPPEMYEVFQQLNGGRMTSDEFSQLLNRYTVEKPEAAQWFDGLYHLINPSEFLAGMAGHKFSRDSFDSRNYSWFDNFLAKLKAWVRAIMDSVKRLLGLRPDIEQIYREILRGTRLTTPETGVDYESGRQGQFEGEPVENAGVDPSELEIEAVKAEDIAAREGWVKTEVLGRKDYVRGRDVLTSAERAAGADYARKVFDRANLQVRAQPNGLWELSDPTFESEIEGRNLLDLLQKEIALQNQPGAVTGYLGNLLNSVVVNMTTDNVEAFSPELRRELYSVAQGERSQRGLLLASLAGFGKTVQYIGRNVDTVLAKVYADRFGGDEIRKVLSRVLTEFRGMFTDAEVQDILSKHPDYVSAMDTILALNRRDEGGRVYRRAQNLLKPKAQRKLSRLEANARVTEAVNEILAQLKTQGIEPKAQANPTLSPLHKLLMLVQPENAEKIDAAIGKAIEDAEHNAGIKAALKNAKDAEERQDLLERFSAGEEPDGEMVEAGLQLPEFSHWLALRDNLLGYSPVTLKVVRQLVQADFRGVNYRKKPAVRTNDTRIDLNVLAKQPEDEVRRVLNAYAQNLEANMDVQGATPETQLRVLDDVQREVSGQLERIRQQLRDRQFAEPMKKGAQPTAEQRLAQLLNAGIFRDERLDVPAMVNRLAARSALQKLVPTVGKLTSAVFSTPFYRQDQLPANFAQSLIDKLQITPEQAEQARKVFQAAFEQKMAQARSGAFQKAVGALTPQQRAVLRRGKGLWKKIEEAVNSGVFDTGVVLQTLAAAHGWNIPSADEIQRVKGWSAEIQRLSELSEQEKRTTGDNAQALALALTDKRAATLEKRIALKKKVEAAWSKMTNPMVLGTPEGRTNIAQAINEFTSANLLFKIGFAPRLAIDILTQGFLHTPTRAAAAAIARYQTDQAAGRTASLWGEINSALRDAYRVRLAAVKANLASALQAMAGKGDARNIDRLVSRIAVFERMELKADDLAAKGDNVRAGILRLVHMVSFSYRVAQTLDNFQGLPAEYQEMRQQVETALRENGMSKAEAMVNADNVIGDMKAEWALAIGRVQEIFAANDIESTANDVKAAAWQVVKSRQYARMRALGLPADDFEEINRVIRSTVAWAEREDGGLGGLIGVTMRKSTEVLAGLGLPMPLARFSNAIATGINRKLMFTPLGFFPGAFKGSPWMRTEQDRLQRKIEASIGTAFGLVAVALVLGGVVRVWLKPPRDKEERDLWEKEGHRANTIEFHLPDGSFIPFSLLIGPMAVIAPYWAAAGAVKDAHERHAKAQDKLNAEAAKAGVTPGNVRNLTWGDYLAVAGETAYESLLGGRTAVGLVSSFTDEGRLPNANKLISSTFSPIVPGLPALQEMSRMAGVNLDPRMASVFDFMVPLPSSAAAKKNLLGDNTGTDDAIQRITQILTGGTYPLPVQPKDAQAAPGYEALFASGYRPPSISPDKGYAINGEMRPMNKTELSRYADLRGQYLKQELEGVSDPTDRKEVQAAYRRADVRALDDVGVNRQQTQAATRSSSGGGTTAVSRGPGAVSSRIGGRRVGASRMIRRGVVRRTGARVGFSGRRGPSLRAGRGISLRPRTAAVRVASLRGRSRRRSA